MARWGPSHLGRRKGSGTGPKKGKLHREGIKGAAVGEATWGVTLQKAKFPFGGGSWEAVDTGRILLRRGDARKEILSSGAKKGKSPGEGFKF